MKKFSALVLASLFSLSAYAEVPLDYQVSLQGVYSQVKAADETFAPRLVHFKAGAVLNDSLFSGIGIQGLLGVPLSDSTKGNLTVDLKSQNGVYLTLSDPETDPESLKFVVLVGYAETKLETTDAQDASAQDTFSGLSYGFSFQQRIFANKPISLNLDCTRFYRDDSLRIDGCGLGASYAF